jgi:hypothetical protein
LAVTDSSSTPVENLNETEAGLQMDQLEAEPLPQPLALASPERSEEDEEKYKVRQRPASR